MIKLKHNKRRNTAFLFEALVKELTKAAINSNEKKKKEITGVLKEFFQKGTILSNELELYKTLYETRNIAEKDAQKIFNEVRRAYSGLSHPHIFQAQSQLISQVNKRVGPQVFSNFVSNYKTLASISQVFNKKIAIKNKVLLENQIISFMTSRTSKKQEIKKLNSVELKLFSSRFNETYSDLLGEQKELLCKYVESFGDNGLEFKIFLNEELARLKEKISESLENKEIKEDKNMLKKTEKVLEIIDNFKGQFINEKMLKKILNIQTLVSEIDAKC